MKHKNILVTRLSAMGDVAICVPIIKQLREKYPEVNISIASTKHFLQLFDGISDLNLIEVQTKSKHKGLKGVIRTFIMLKNSNQFDVVIDLHDVIRTKIIRFLFKLSGVKIVHIDKERALKKDLVKNKTNKTLKRSIDRYVECFTALGFDIKLDNKLVRSTKELPEHITKLFDLKKHKINIGIAPFAQHQGKIYPLDKMEEVINMLSKEDSMSIFLFGGSDSEKEFAEKMEDRYTNVYSVIRKITISDELKLISNLDLMLSMDSGAAHMSSIVGVRCLSIWGATHPNVGFLAYGQSLNDVISIDMGCRPCSVYGNKQCYKGTYECMNLITPKDITAKVLNSL